jgi:hypothetical protein
MCVFPYSSNLKDILLPPVVDGDANAFQTVASDPILQFHSLEYLR